MTEHIEVAISKDREPFGDFRRLPMPDWGQRRDPQPTLRRGGIAREFKMRIRYTEPTTLVLIAAEIQAG